MWQVLILFGIGDPARTEWDGNLSTRGGEILSMEAHRQEPPERILPQGGWKLRTHRIRVLLGSEVVPRPPAIFR